MQVPSPTGTSWTVTPTSPQERAIDGPAPIVKDKNYLYSGRKSFAVWLDWTEWQTVYADVFASELNLLDDGSDSPHTRKLRALSYMAAWRARSDVPVAVEVTAQLVEISCHDSLLGLALPGRSAYRSHEELRLLYSATVVRCVNGLVDASQRGAYAQAVSSLALRIGIPLWIVDIRHEAAHTKLPSLPTLQLACQTLRQWLFEHYWHPQDAAIKQRVAQVGSALSRRLHFNEPLRQLLGLDVATLSGIVVPLLVQGHQYGERVSSDGTIVDLLPKDVALDFTRFDAEWLQLCGQDSLRQVVEECQGVWDDFVGWFLVAVARELCRICQDETQDVKSVLLAKWIVHVASPDTWTLDRRGHRLPVAASYALALLRNSPEQDNLLGHYWKAAEAALVACSTNDHPANVENDVITSWKKFEVWTPSPMGTQLPFGSIARDLSLTDAVDEWDSGNLIVLSELPPADTSMMADFDAKYFANVAAIVDARNKIADEIVVAGHTSHNESISHDEVVRLQNAIEIW
ncbi:hypothetical protein, variant 1 [Aphanomyces astaci]|uniref:Uncharacterized protein n=2 Tax=Aphanomyces astaci TaxID=112090 RepID=W4G0K7_APHAT|nr:hypothetical protein, variant 1 [Aphanomyces astaci]ETV72473.1 hypothetical protein, variant 1 [Aphanomyces astaci]|eukprot:XP_009838155.1 hypothetical protein, variant 1 [Aphanomyces astaci]